LLFYRVEEVMTNVTQFSPVTDIVDWLDDTCEADYGDPSYENGTVLHYACQSCGYVLYQKSAAIFCYYGVDYDDNSFELFEWLKKHDMLEETG